MGKFKYILLGISLAGSIYASKRAIHSYLNFNKTIKQIDCQELRRSVNHLNEDIEIRKK